jgi:hypothetical protein
MDLVPAGETGRPILFPNAILNRRHSMSATLTNGKPRKQLSDQLDRLDEQLQRHDQILDALAEGLNGAVAEATKEGTRLAVKDAVIELLTDPVLRAALHQATTSRSEPKVTVWSKLKAKVRQAATRAVEATRPVRQAVAARVAAAHRAAVAATGPARLAWRLRKVLLVGLGVGVVAAAVAYAGGQSVGAALSGIGAALTTIVIQVAVWIRTTVRRFALT